MAIRRYKPTSAGRRFMTVSSFDEITKSEPEKSLTRPLKKSGGRNKHGRITRRHQGGGLAFPPQPRSFEVKVNRKARKSALRAALSAHAGRGSLGILGDDSFDEPSTKSAASMLDAWGKDRPLIVVAQAEQKEIHKSFRNLDRVLVLTPDELEVSAVLWARALLVSEAALEQVKGRAQ